MEHIRPHQILSLGQNFDEPYQAFLPPNYAGGIMALEAVMLVKLLKLLQPRKLFEFGTYRGDTTRLLLENMEPDAHIHTLDLDSADGVTFQGNDGDLASHATRLPRKYELSARRNQVTQLLLDSMQFDPSPFHEQMQFIFIDANHELSYVKQDSENALAMLAPENSVIIWHDYRNKQFPELTSYLEALPLTLHHIEETMLVLYLRGIEIPGRSTGIYFTQHA
jgi:hypothetical protein